MKNLVMIKSFPNGLSVVLDPDAPFQEIVNETAVKFLASSKFFGDARMIISFEGRELQVEEEKKLVDAICDHSDLTVLCVVGKDEEKNQEYLKAASKFTQNGDHTDGQFYKGTIRAGQVLETESSVIILGDINPGAQVISAGNIVILGTLYGEAHAGSLGNSACFIVALDMKPSMIRIGEIETTDPVRSTLWKNKQAPKIAYVEDEVIKTEAITTALLNQLQV